MNNPFGNVNHPLNYPNRTQTESNRPNQQDKRPPQYPFIPMLPFRMIPVPSMPQNSSNSSSQQIPFRLNENPQQHDNVAMGECIKYLQNIVFQLQANYKHMYDLFANSQLELNQKTLENNYWRNLYEESCAEKIRLIHNQNLYMTNPMYLQSSQASKPLSSNPLIKIDSEKRDNLNCQKTDIKSHQKDIKQMIKQHLKQIEKKQVQQKPKKKQILLTGKQKQKNLHETISESQEKKEKFIQEQQSEKKSVEEYKYYNKALKSQKQQKRHKEYKKKLRDRQKNDEKAEKIEEKGKRNKKKQFEYVQLDMAPKALKKLKESFLALKAQKQQGKQADGVLNQENKTTTLTKRKYTKSKKEDKKKQVQQSLEQQNQKNDKKVENQRKKFLSEFESENSESDKIAIENIPSYSILKPLLEIQKQQKCETQKPKQQLMVSLPQNQDENKFQQQQKKSNQRQKSSIKSGSVIKYEQLNQVSKKKKKQHLTQLIKINVNYENENADDHEKEYKRALRIDQKEKQDYDENQNIPEEHNSKNSNFGTSKLFEDQAASIKISIKQSHLKNPMKQQPNSIKSNKQTPSNEQIQAQTSKQMIKATQPALVSKSLNKTIKKQKLESFPSQTNNQNDKQQNFKVDLSSILNNSQLLEIEVNEQLSKPRNQIQFDIVPTNIDNVNYKSQQQAIEEQQEIAQLQINDNQINASENTNPIDNTSQHFPQASLPKKIKINRIKLESSRDEQENQLNQTLSQPPYPSSQQQNPLSEEDERKIIVHYDHELTKRRRRKKIKIPCVKGDPFMIIKNWRQYQKFTNYGFVFQGVYANEDQENKQAPRERQTKNNDKYDQQFSYKLTKKQRKQRKVRGKYKKRRPKVAIHPQEDLLQPEQPSVTIQSQNSESIDRNAQVNDRNSDDEGEQKQHSYQDVSV